MNNTKTTTTIESISQLFTGEPNLKPEPVWEGGSATIIRVANPFGAGLNYVLVNLLPGVDTSPAKMRDYLKAKFLDADDYTCVKFKLPGLPAGTYKIEPKTTSGTNTFEPTEYNETVYTDAGLYRKTLQSDRMNAILKTDIFSVKTEVLKDGSDKHYIMAGGVRFETLSAIGTGFIAQLLKSVNDGHDLQGSKIDDQGLLRESNKNK
jgi:hypothetical protein